jgi:endonuclease-3
MLKKERYQAFVDYFSKHQPNAETELQYSNPYELLVAVILSAQCTDKRINQVTPKLFERFPNPESLAESNSDEVFGYIRSVSYPNNKAKHLVGMAQMLVSEFNSEVPSTVENLQKLPGVGRKTANVIASVVHQAPAMAVDTHVFRVANRLGLTSKAKTPLAVEKQLVKHLPKDKIHVAHHWLILHGRYICLARNPKCEQCPISWFCKYYEQQHTEAALIKAEKAKQDKKELLKKKKAQQKTDSILKKLSIKK